MVCPPFSPSVPLFPHWTVAGAQAMLQLRCIAINQQWEDFTAFRVQRESERLYPHTTLYEIEDWPIPQAA